MRFVVPTVLILVAVVHVLPIMGVFAASKLAQLYGITVQDPNLELLLWHRAVLFGLLARISSTSRPLAASFRAQALLPGQGNCNTPMECGLSAARSSVRTGPGSRVAIAVVDCSRGSQPPLFQLLLLQPCPMRSCLHAVAAHGH